MRKFIKYNLLFVTAFIVFTTLTANVNAENYVTINDGCIYMKEGDKFHTIPDVYIEGASNSDTSFIGFNLVTNSSSNDLPSDYSTIDKEYVKNHIQFLVFYDSTIMPYYLFMDDLTFLQDDTGKYWVCNKNNTNISDKCFPIAGNYKGEYVDGSIFKYGGYKKGECGIKPNQKPDEPDKPSEEKPNINSCFDIKDENSCKTDDNFSCIWVNKGGGYCNVDNLQYVKCGDAFDIPSKIPPITSFLINFLKIVTPIVLIIVSIISLVKAIMASKEDEMQKATQGLKRRVIAAGMVFFVISIVQFVIFKVADSSETGSIGDCLSCFINNKCDGSEYFKTNVNGRYECHYLNNINSAQTCPEDEK